MQAERPEPREGRLEPQKERPEPREERPELQKERPEPREGKPGIRKKILLLVWCSVLPMAALAAGAIVSINSLYRQYDRSVQSITAVNEYNIVFEEELNRSMYYIITETYDWEELRASGDEQNPYVRIGRFRERLEELRRNDSSPGIRNDIDAIGRMLNSLVKRIDDIISNVEEGGHYDENMELLQSNIYVLTGLIQKDIEDYIYLEAVAMEETRRAISSNVSTTLLVLVLGVAALIAFTFVLSSGISKKITDPIREMCRTTEQFAGGDFSVRFHAGSGDEIETLADSFNSMVGEISALVEDVKKEQANLKDAELRLLQEQINPHFLYNTLDAIMWLVESGQNDKAVSMVSSLSGFFRTTLSKGREWVTVREEKSHIESYLEIQKFRYADILDYAINIPEEMDGFSLMKLMLQPIVENALYHGIKNKRGRGFIRVSGRMGDGELFFIVEDDGIGMRQKELDRMRKLISGEITEELPHGFGIANVAQRIRLHYGEKYGIEVESAYGEGCRVTVRIPQVIRAEGEALL